METVMMPNTQPDVKLQQLYLLSKHWIADIDFSDGEIRFLKNMFHRYLVPTPGYELLIKASALESDLDLLGLNIPELKDKVAELLRFIDPPSERSPNVAVIDLTNTFFSLQGEIKMLFNSVKQVKTKLFLFVEQIMKADHDI